MSKMNSFSPGTELRLLNLVNKIVQHQFGQLAYLNEIFANKPKMVY